MISAFGIDHGAISKGLPSAVRSGGGGVRGALLRSKHETGRVAAEVVHRPHLKNLADINISRGKDVKAYIRASDTRHAANQNFEGKAARRLRAALLNEDIAARQAGFKTGKSSGLNRGYRGRVNSQMTKLP